MLKRNFITALRFFRITFKATLINITGLTIALVFFFIISVYIQYEKSYDNFHAKEDRIVRILSNSNETNRKMAVTPYIWMPALLDAVPEVERVTSFLRFTPSFRKDGIMLSEPLGLGVEPSFFDVFDFPVISGNQKQFLRSIGGIVVTDKMALKYFGTLDVLGKSMSSYDDEGNPVDYLIEGVVKCPQNSHVQFDYLLSFELSKISYRIRSQRLGLPNRFQSWETHFCSNYLMLREDAEPDLVLNKLNQLIESNWNSKTIIPVPSFQPLSEIYLRSDLSNDFPPRGDAQLLQTLRLVSIGLIFLTLVNFTNLSVVMSLKRVKEIGLRKTFGSGSIEYSCQFILESFLLILISTIIAVFVVWILLPKMDQYLGVSVELNILLDNFPYLVLLICVLSVVAGLYPAIKFSVIKPSQVLHSGSSYGIESNRLRSVLVVFQVCISVVLITCTTVIFKQIHFLTNKDLGFKKEYKAVLTHWGIGESNKEIKRLRTELEHLPEVLAVSASNNIPGRGRSFYHQFRLPGTEMNEPLNLSTFYSDMRIVDALDLEIVKGRDFSESISSDSTFAYIINEAALNLFGQYDESWKENPINQNLTRILSDGERRGRVIGVVRDFHYDSFKKEIEPLVICIESLGRSRVIIKLNTSQERLGETLTTLRTMCQNLYPNSSFDFRLLEDQFDAYYKAHRTNGKLILLFALLTMVIAGIGVMGLVTFTSRLKRKEFSIRKVVGASTTLLMLFLFRRFAILVFIGCFLAFPISHLLLTSWLDQFAYRINIPFGLYLLVMIFCLALTGIIVIYSSLADIRKSPVSVLRTE